MSNETHENTGQFIRTICQDLYYGNSTIEQDTVISSLMADGWQVINVSIIPYTDNSGDRPVNGISRYTTLQKFVPVSKPEQPAPAKLPAFKPGDRVSISPDSKIRAYRGEVGTIVDYRTVEYLVHWDETPEDMMSVIESKDLKGE